MNPHRENPHRDDQSSLKGGAPTDNGFTIVELVIVVGLLIIISFFAISSYLGTQRDTEDVRVRGNLEMAAARGEEAARFNSRTYPASEDLASIISQDTQISAVTGPSNGPTNVSVAQIDSRTAVYVALSESGRCWALVDSMVHPNQWTELTTDTGCGAATFDMETADLYATWDEALSGG